MERPLLIFDGECGYCRRWVRRLAPITGERIEYAPFQEAAARAPQIAPAEFERAAFLIYPDGSHRRGMGALFGALAIAGRGSLLWMYSRLPGFAPLMDLIYSFVARNRGFMNTLDRWAFGADPAFHGNSLTIWLFLRALALVYFIAFASLAVQITTLVGEHGLLPARDFFERADGVLALRGITGLERFWLLPTLCWMGSGDAWLNGLCLAGLIGSVLLFLDFFPLLLLFALWVIYLSLANAGGIFLQYQWDALLLECGFLALFVAPFRLLPAIRLSPASRLSLEGRLSPEGRFFPIRFTRDAPASRAGVWLLRWLLFRLMFSSGMTKLLSGDDTWRNLTALDYHYETQPIPSWISWYFHQLPAWFQQISVLVMFFVELAVPFAMLFPRVPRAFACLITAALQVAILISGNYGFFNFLTLALCILLLDDSWWPRRFRDRFDPGARARGALERWLSYPRVLLALAAFAFSLVPLLDAATRLDRDFLGPLADLHARTEQFKSCNSYGLFRSMTTTRPEVVIEGSLDGISFVPYEFPYKPGDVQRAPPFLGPHMPRLDWQLWFMGLEFERGVRREESARILESLSRHIFKGSPLIREVFAKVPFEGRIPSVLRFRLLDYRFTKWGVDREAIAAGNWWRVDDETLLWTSQRR